MARVSVIMPVYNGGTYIREALQSALNQTYADFELLVVDDGSTDDTRAQAQLSGDPRVRVLTQVNQGSYVARNTGIANTSGELIAFLDSDDVWEPDKLEKQVAYVDTHPEVGLLHTSVSLIDAQGRPAANPIYAHAKPDVWLEMLTYNEYYLIRSGSTPLIRRSCFEKVGVFDDRPLAEDWATYTRVARHFGVAAIPEPLVRYRQHGGNITKNYRIMEENFDQLIQDMFEGLPEEVQPLKRKTYGRTYLSVAWRAFYAGNVAEARRLYGLALARFPRLRLTKTGAHLGARLFLAVIA